MLNYEYFYHGLIRKYTALMGALVDNVYVERVDSDGGTLSMMKVPVQLATKEKMLARLQGDPAIDLPYSNLVPRMSWELTGLQYDGQRKLNTINRRVIKTDDVNKFKFVRNPVPFDFYFKVCIYAKNQEDVAKIVEQILVFFTPDWTTSVVLVPEMDISHDIPTILMTTNIEDLYSEDYKERRFLTWDLEFVMKGYLYGPVVTKPIIKFANTRFDVYSSEFTNNFFSAVTIQPGLTANGEPTTNAAASVSPLLIDVDDPYGYVEIIVDRGSSEYEEQ